MPLERVSYEAQIYFNCRQHGLLPKDSIYELDAALALMLLSIDEELGDGSCGQDGDE